MLVPSRHRAWKPTYLYIFRIVPRIFLAISNLCCTHFLCDRRLCFSIRRLWGFQLDFTRTLPFRFFAFLVALYLLLVILLSNLPQLDSFLSRIEQFLMIWWFTLFAEICNSLQILFKSRYANADIMLPCWALFASNPCFWITIRTLCGSTNTADETVIFLLLITRLLLCFLSFLASLLLCSGCIFKFVLRMLPFRGSCRSSLFICRVNISSCTKSLSLVTRMWYQLTRHLVALYTLLDAAIVRELRCLGPQIWTWDAFHTRSRWTWITIMDYRIRSNAQWKNVSLEASRRYAMTLSGTVSTQWPPLRILVAILTSMELRTLLPLKCTTRLDWSIYLVAILSRQ